MSKIFTETVLALCADRTKLAQENSIIGSPDAWFDEELLKSFNLRSVSFDFFINWSTYILDRNIWIKRPILDHIDINTLSDETVVNSLREDKFLELVYFSRKNQLTTSAIIFNDNQDWSNEQSRLLHVYWPKNNTDTKGLRVDRVDLKYVKQQIQSKSGGSVAIGSKGLTYGTSLLECSLSKTDALWPGDADLVLLNWDYSPLAILEFKKHTASSGISFDEQKLSNYYPKPDGRKYDRLKYLSDQLNEGISIPLFVVYYSVIQTECRIIVEQVVGKVNSLSAGKRDSFLIDPAEISGSVSVAIKYISEQAKI